MAGKPKLKTNRRLYVNAAGETASRPMASATMLRYELFGSLPQGKEDKAENYPTVKTVEFPISAFPDEILRLAAFHGLSQKIGDTAFNSVEAAAKDEGFTPDVENAYAAFVEGRLQDVVDNLTSGVWTEEKEGSGNANVRIIAEAVLRTLTAQGKAPADPDAALASLIANLKNDEKRKATAANPAVKVHVAAITAERAAARAKELAKEAKGSTVDTEALSGLLA